jgi:AcrR family transcriptional regulator
VRARRYESPLRADQAERTREKVLEALAGQLADARDEFSISKVAKRAGVSTRTVYHYFPNRESQVEALASWIEKRTGGAIPMPSSARDLPALVERLYQRFFEHEQILRAQLALGIARDVRARRREKTSSAIEACVRATRVPPEDVHAVGVLMRHLISGNAGLAMIDDLGLDGPSTTKVTAWAVRVIVDALERGDGPSRPPRPG